MSHVVVISSDLRRTTVKVTPQSFLIDILEAACATFKLPSDKYLLKHGKRQLNLTDPFRSANLSQGAKLDLVVKSKSPSVVTVALRLPETESRLGIPNNRVSDRLRSDTTVWKLLRHFEETGVGKLKGLNLTGRGVPHTSNGAQSGSGQMFWEVPVLKVAGRELESLEHFQKTLAQIGIDSGSQLIMVEFKRTGTTLQEAMQNAEQFFSEIDADAIKPASAASSATQAPEAHKESSSSNAAAAKVVDTNAQLPSEGASESKESASEIPQPQTEDTTTPAPDKMDLDNEAPSSSSAPQPIEVWAPATSGTLAAIKMVEDETAFAPTIAQMQAHQQHLKAGTANSRLKSDKELEADARAAAARLASVTRVDIRVRFPDGHVVKWAFGPDAAGADLYAAVRTVLAEPAARPFKLVLPAAGGDIADAAGGDKHRLIKGYGLKGGVVVTFIVLDAAPGEGDLRGQTYLKQTVLSRAHEVVVPEIPQGVIEEAAPVRPGRAEDAGGDDGAKKSGRPKWFKFGKK